MMSPVRSTRRSLLVTLLSLALACAFAPTQPAQAETSFKFWSRGYGHGLGMSQYGAKAFAEHGVGYADILRYYYGNAGRDPKTTVLTLSGEPACDVNLDGAASYSASSSTYNAGYTRSLWTLRPGHAGAKLTLVAGGTSVTLDDGWMTFTGSGSSIIVNHPSWSAPKTYTGTVRVYGAVTGPPLVQVKEPTGHYDHTYVRFRGEMRLSASSGRIKLLNHVSMRDYLYGVVPRESPASWPAEALKTQAVAARGYAYTSTGELYTDTRSQVYGGHSRGEDRTSPEMHEYASTNSAVDATSNRVVAYNGQAVRTYFFSTSGGYTENNENVWGGTALPYLRGVPDPYESTAGSSRHTWTEQSFSATEVRSRLLSAGISSTLLPAQIADIRVTNRGVSGRPTRIEITGTTGAKTYIEGSTNLDRFKNAFSWGDRWFVVDPKTSRVAGVDRYETSVKASQKAFSSAGSARVAVVVGGKAPADALAASALAGAGGGGPVLLTPASALDSRIRGEIVRLGVSKVYVMGGDAVVSQAVEDAVNGISGVATVVRISGVDRYETSAKAAAEIKRLNGQSSRAIVVSGESIVDAVAVSGLAYAGDIPVVLVKKTSVPSVSAAALTGVSTSLVVGGAGAVSDGVLAQIPGGTRIAAGADRYETAAMLGDYLVTHEGFGWNRCYVASGTSLVDALSIGPAAGVSRNPVLFAETYEFDPATKDRLLTKKPFLAGVWMVGGEAAMSGWVQTRVEATLE